MRKQSEDLWNLSKPSPYLIAVTTNSVANKMGELVMGVRSARQAKELYYWLPRLAVTTIKHDNPRFILNGTEDYGFLELIPPPCGVGIFQTKRHWASTSILKTIELSTKMLRKFAEEHPDIQIRLTFPGMGAGRWGTGEKFNREQVLNVLNVLPNNVIVLRW